MLAQVITKWLVAGMSLTDCIERTTIAAARAIGWSDRVGSLTAGHAADISVFELAPVSVMLEDCQSQLRPCSRRLICRAVWKDGQQGQLTQPKAWPNPETVALQRPAWEMLLVRDPLPPPLPPPPVLATLANNVLVPLRTRNDAEGSGDWNPQSGFAGLMALLGEGG